MNNKELGNIGEAAAADFLMNKGYRIRERQYRIREAEVDIIAEKDGVIVFVEVKTRRSIRCGSPAMAVTAAKQRKIVRGASWYIMAKKLHDRLCRFDVVEVIVADDGQLFINQLENAFEVC